jgi:hypothetical protein
MESLQILSASQPVFEQCVALSPGRFGGGDGLDGLDGLDGRAGLGGLGGVPGLPYFLMNLMSSALLRREYPVRPRVFAMVLAMFLRSGTL